MADVRLTAVNPEDSQVYPVACNDKGELLLESTTGDFDVPGTLTVGPGPGATVSPDGSASFTSNLDTQILVESTSSSGNNEAAIELIRGSNQSAIKNKAGGLEFYTGGPPSERMSISKAGDITATGSATFADDITNGPAWDTSTSLNQAVIQNGAIFSHRTAGTSVAFSAYLGSGNNRTVNIKADGSATFAGNVTAPNINFKLAPEYVTTLPAPLIDEGFVANNSIDLLTELIKMKIQIRDLNAFMERSIQENPET